MGQGIGNKFPCPAEGIEHDYFLIRDFRPNRASAWIAANMRIQRLFGSRFRPGTIREMM
jgi:hypothetical protein